MTKKNWSFECVWDNQFKLVILTKKVIGQFDQLFIGQNSTGCRASYNRG
jgi:hypothetical protein